MAPRSSLSAKVNAVVLGVKVHHENIEESGSRLRRFMDQLLDDSGSGLHIVDSRRSLLLRKTRWGAFGHPLSKRETKMVSPSPAPEIAFWYAGAALASLEQTKRVPRTTPAASAEMASAMSRPSATPPATITGSIPKREQRLVSSFTALPMNAPSSGSGRIADLCSRGKADGVRDLRAVLLVQCKSTRQAAVTHKGGNW